MAAGVEFTACASIVAYVSFQLKAARSGPDTDGGDSLACPCSGSRQQGTSSEVAMVQWTLHHHLSTDAAFSGRYSRIYIYLIIISLAIRQSMCSMIFNIDHS